MTDEESIQIVEQVLNNEVNPEIVQSLEEYGCKARGIHGEDILTVVKHTEKDAETGEVLDWGFVGEVVNVDVEPIKAYLQAGIMPVITPLGRGPDGKLYNINADEAAAAIAESSRRGSWSSCRTCRACWGTRTTRVDHVHAQAQRSRGADQARRDRRRHAAEDQRRGQGAEGGRAEDAHHRRRLPHSLLLELFTDKGVGTEIVQ